MEKLDFNKVYLENISLVERYIKPRIYPHIECADEIISDTFLKVYQNLDSYNPDKGKISTWIVTIAKNKLIDYFRSIKIEKLSKTNYLDSKHQTDAIYNINSDNTTDGEMIYSESINAIKKAITGLDEKMQIIADLRYFRQYKYEEIAAELKMPIGTVKTHISRLKTYLVKHTELV